MGMEKDGRKILKVKNPGGSGGKVVIVYEVARPGYEPDEFAVSCGALALPSFYTALDGLKKHVVEICEFAHDYSKGMTIGGVSFSWTNDVMGVVISATRSLKATNSPFSFNTPHSTAEPYSEGGDETVLLSSTCCVALDLVMGEAIKYLDGKRAQGELFGDEKGAKA